ncbi:MAG: XdhC/CoxI family protein [Gemmatimonadota bacterium]
MSFSEIRSSVEGWTQRGQASGVATLFRVQRSAPRRPGARFAASMGGAVAGSISSGCIEADLSEAIREVVRDGTPRLMHYGISDELAASVGLACGGDIDVLVEPHRPGEAAWAALGEALDGDEAALLFTGLSEDIRTRKMLVRPDGSRVGSLGSEALDAEACEDARSLLDTGGAAVLSLAGGATEVFAEAYLPSSRLAIVGGGLVAQALCHLAAFAGIAVTLVDPRSQYAQADQYPDARHVFAEWPEEGLGRMGLDPYVSVVVLSHDHKLDVPALSAALRAGCRYIGLLGGRRTQRLRREALADEGFSDSDLSQIHGPVGMDIGAQSPQEIALSILAELLAVLRGRDSGRSGA